MRHAYGLVFIGLIAVVGCSSANTDDTSASTSDDLKAKTCKEPSDCKGALPDLCRICSDGSESCAHWDCESGKCAIETCDAPPPDPNACTTASDCTGPLPKICEICPDGTEQCAHHACVGGTCETETCEGHTTPPPPPPECKKASDCHGVLPDFCRLCSDGSESCAHWACESGSCEITTCN